MATQRETPAGPYDSNVESTGRSAAAVLLFRYGNFWPGPEILAINLIAENPPFDSTWHEKFRCNRHGLLMAGRVKSPRAASEHFSSQNLDLADWPVWRKLIYMGSKVCEFAGRKSCRPA